jgi:N-acetylneuraminic acid mutarotase
VLQDNGGDNLTVNANAAFTFATQVLGGTSYVVTVLTQPTGQYCSVTGGSGTVPANNVTTVAVSCTDVWTWVTGAETINASGVYGTLGTGSTANVPGARSEAISWTDSAGNLWLFGGAGYDSTGASNYLNDLWQYTPSNRQWTWVSGAKTQGAPGAYGTLGAGSTANVPGARQDSISWTDNAGNLWLFGGLGYDSTGASGYLNDLWQFAPSTQEWKWVSGAKTINASGVYGTLGTGSTANVPGARGGAISWADSAGNLWLFGGYGFDSSGTNGNLNDLWQYTPSTQQWTWVSGAKTINASGVYGTLGTGSTANVPGARHAAVPWTDSAGNLWLFGGLGNDSTGAGGDLNDLWQYTPSNQQWTWVSGAKTINAFGIYGTLGTGSTTNVPGARNWAVSWTDSAGNLWLFGGYGYDSTGASGYFTSLNDLWKYTPSTQQWAWVSGAKTINASGAYGTLGTGSTTNVPGARQSALSWTDSAGNFWLFGGYGYDSTGAIGSLNDLWRY